VTESLTDWMAPNRLRISIDLHRLDEHDMAQFSEDASDLEWVYHRRERLLVSSSLMAVSGAADAALEDSRSPDPDMWGASYDVSLPFDPSSNPEQNKDELGTLMARVMALAERQDIDDDLAHVWFGVVRQLARERDRLRRERVIL